MSFKPYVFVFPFGASGLDSEITFTGFFPEFLMAICSSMSSASLTRPLLRCHLGLSGTNLHGTEMSHITLKHV